MFEHEKCFLYSSSGESINNNYDDVTLRSLFLNFNCVICVCMNIHVHNTILANWSSVHSRNMKEINFKTNFQY